MANRKFNIEVDDKIEVTCTDNEQVVEVEFISQHQDTIKTNLQGMPLNFKLARENIYVANFLGREFVMKL
jgi:hypothetical protein